MRRRDRAAAGRELEGRARVHDLAGDGDARHDRELDPLDVADDADPRRRAHSVSAGALRRSQARGCS